MSPSPRGVVLRDVTFNWPDGTAALTGVSGSFARTRTGLVGANGAGKTTLLRLVAGSLQPDAGTITTSGPVEHLPQDVTRGSGTIADRLGVAIVRRALREIEAGSTDPTHFDMVGDLWDIEERAVALLAGLGLPTDLDREVATLSGGEAMLTAIAGVRLRLRPADIALLDEPTNNLDAAARQRLYEVVAQWRGTLIVVSHDVDLLDLMDQTAELRNGELSTFGGPYWQYQQWLQAQQEAAAQVLHTAQQDLRRQQRERAKAEQRFAHSARQGERDRQRRKFVPAAINGRRNAAQKSQGSRRQAANARVDAARAAVAAADRSIRDDVTVRIDLPDPQVPRARRLLELSGPDGRGTHVIQGPERVGLMGPNGSGKTTLIESVLPGAGARVAYLPQRIDLDGSRTVLQTVRAAAPDVPAAQLRNRLARLLLRGEHVDRAVATLSGGERFRVALARALFADPPPQLLVLDEPTNDLDLDTVDQLVAALGSYRGALLVVSHDRRFLDQLGLHVWLHLDSAGSLCVVQGWSDVG